MFVTKILAGIFLSLTIAVQSLLAADRVGVTAVVVGRSVDSANQIDDPATVFLAGEKVYVSVQSQTTPIEAHVPGSLGVRWFFGEVEIPNVAKTSRVDFEGNGWTAFDISRPKGMPIGYYGAHISLNGVHVATISFEVVESD